MNHDESCGESARGERETRYFCLTINAQRNGDGDWETIDVSKSSLNILRLKRFVTGLDVESLFL